MANPDFRAIAAAYGISAEDVAERHQLHDAVSRMIASPDAYLLNINIDETDLVLPMTPAGKPVDYIMLDRNRLFEFQD